jgi:hypothetical protein
MKLEGRMAELLVESNPKLYENKIQIKKKGKKKTKILSSGSEKALLFVF